MKNCTAFIIFLLLLSTAHVTAQSCSTLGQTPATAFPLCTKDTFVQTTVPICTNKDMLVPGCSASNASYQDKNPFWYRFTCYQTGSLRFVITPNDLRDDYDWQLFDITGISDLNTVYTNRQLFVVANWSGSSGLTGATAAGTNIVECGSDPAENINTFSKMPDIQIGHTYLLMISHFSDSQSGYKLYFGGGTAVINDPALPDLKKADISCDASTISLKLVSKMKCTSVATNGSDFSISPAVATVVAATGVGCSNSFDMDSLTLVLSNPLPPGNYNLVVKTGTDVNTLLDDCDRDIPVGHQIPFTVAVLQPTPLDSISPPKCAPSQLQLVFSKAMQCNSIAADGSDFIVTGPSVVTVSGASGDCDQANLSKTITIKLASPIVVGGTYKVQLKTGTDFNNIIDMCGQETPAGASVNFTIKDTVYADFTYQIHNGCLQDTVDFSHDGAHGVNQWLWSLGGVGASSQQNTSAIFQTFGNKQIRLIVSNGFCVDTLYKTIALNNQVIAAFETNTIICPEDAATFKNVSTGPVTGYNWVLGNGNTSENETPDPQKFPLVAAEKTYLVKLIVENSDGCYDTATNKIKVLKSCYIAVPNAFTPNGDGNNDYLYPLNALKADNLEFNVYNRLGQLVFHTTDWTKKWDGTINGQLQGSGNYVWTLQYINHDTGKKVFLKGTSVLLR